MYKRNSKGPTESCPHMGTKYDVDPVARLESFRALKLSRLLKVQEQIIECLKMRATTELGPVQCLEYL